MGIFFDGNDGQWIVKTYRGTSLPIGYSYIIYILYIEPLPIILYKAISTKSIFHKSLAK